MAAADAIFALSCVKAGLTPDGGATHTLGTHLPRATLMRLMLLAEAVALAGWIADGPRTMQIAIKALVQSATLWPWPKPRPRPPRTSPPFSKSGRPIS